MELERWSLIIYLLISLNPSDGFACRDLQVKALTETHLFGVLFARFGHLEAPHDHFEISWGPSRTFRRKRCTLGAHVGKL